MRVLHLPFNIATQMSCNIRGLRRLGVEATGLAPLSIVADNSAIEPMWPMDRRRPLHWLVARTRNALVVLRAIRSADIVHWYFAPGIPGALDVRWAKWLGKPCLIEFCGSDIRNPEIESRDNPYYARAFTQGYEYAHVESAAHSRWLQSVFDSARAVACTPSPSLDDYLVDGLLPERHRLRSRIWLDDFPASYAEPYPARLNIIHSPTAPCAKGTAYVERAVAALSAELPLDYVRVQNMPHAEARRVMQGCDIFLDQFVLGDYGVASIEAMAYGKPVVCYIKPGLRARMPSELPIVTATGDELPGVLRRLAADAGWRQRLGREGRAFVEKYHDAKHLAHDLKAIYQSMLEGR